MILKFESRLVIVTTRVWSVLPFLTVVPRVNRGGRH